MAGWENNLLYSILRPYVDLCTLVSYRRFRTEGSLPSDGRAVIISPNHTGTLMDALVVLRTRKGPTLFGARADMFNNPTVASVMRFLRIVPMVRRRDGLREVLRNRDSMKTVDEVLSHGVPFCMFPEGRHRPMHSLLPLQKGIARIAFASASERPTCIVPVGIEYDDFFHYRSTCTIRFGEPLDVNGFLAGHPDLGEAELSRKLLEELSGRMKELFLCLPDDPSYRARLREVRPPRPRKSVILRRLSALVLLPLFLLSAVLSFPLWPIAEGICRFYLADKAFGNTVRYMCRLLGMPLMLVVWTVLALCFLPAAVAWTVPVLFLFSYSFFYDWLNLWRK